MLRPDKKKIAWIRYIVGNMSRLVQLVLDPFAGTLDVAKACSYMLQYLRFVIGRLRAGHVEAINEDPPFVQN